MFARLSGFSDGDDYHSHAVWFCGAVRPEMYALKPLFQLAYPAGDLPLVFTDLAAGAVAPAKVLVRWGSALTPQRRGKVFTNTASPPETAPAGPRW